MRKWTEGSSPRGMSALSDPRIWKAMSWLRRKVSETLPSSRVSVSDHVRAAYAETAVAMTAINRISLFITGYSLAVSAYFLIMDTVDVSEAKTEYRPCSS